MERAPTAVAKLAKKANTRKEPGATKPPNPDKLLLTPGEVEHVYGIPKSTQAKNRMAGTFAPFIKRGRSVYVLRSDMDSWLAGLRRKSTFDPKHAA